MSSWRRLRPASEPVASLVRCELETGRTHQIRVHMAHIGHPLLGDATYGSGFKTKANRLSRAAREAARGPRPPGSPRRGARLRASGAAASSCVSRAAPPADLAALCSQRSAGGADS